MSEKENASEEVSSESEEEILMDVDEGAETQQAIDAILEDSEQLEHNEEHAQERYLEAKRRGKQKAAKTPQHDGDMWKELKRLQSQLASLQSANKRSHDDNATGSSKEKRRKVDVDNKGAFDLRAQSVLPEYLSLGGKDSGPISAVLQVVQQFAAESRRFLIVMSSYYTFTSYYTQSIFLQVDCASNPV